MMTDNNPSRPDVYDYPTDRYKRDGGTPDAIGFGLLLIALAFLPLALLIGGLYLLGIGLKESASNHLT